jgi:hypothetical protein
VPAGSDSRSSRTRKQTTAFNPFSVPQEHMVALPLARAIGQEVRPALNPSKGDVLRASHSLSVRRDARLIAQALGRFERSVILGTAGGEGPVALL